MTLVIPVPSFLLSFFFNDTATTEIYTLSLHDALPILFAATAPAHATLVLSSFSGTLAPGASQGHVWVNLPSNTAYEIGLSPVGASTAAMCEFEVTDQWYEGLSTGERRLRATIKNIGSLACGTN